MTAALTEETPDTEADGDTSLIVAQAPIHTRQRVLFESFELVAAAVRGNSGKWHLVGGGPMDRYKVFSQTAYRIRCGLIKAFTEPEGGYWEANVSTDKRVDRDYPVEVYMRFVPVEPKG